MAQGSKCACVAVAVAGMAKQRMESTHTLAMLSVCSGIVIRLIVVHKDIMSGMSAV